MSDPVILNDSFVGAANMNTKMNQELEMKPESELAFHSEVLTSVFLTDENVIDNTPMFDELDFVLESTNKEDWVSLFDASNEIDSNAHFNQVVNDEDLLDPIIDLAETNPAFDSVDSVTESSVASSKNSRKRAHDQLLTPSTSALPTPNLDTPKLDHLGVVKYSKKTRSQPLEPIKLSSNDPILMKRAKNTEAARRSRARKMERMGQLEEKVNGLMETNKDLNSEISRLKQLLDLNHIKY